MLKKGYKWQHPLNVKAQFHPFRTNFEEKLLIIEVETQKRGNFKLEAIDKLPILRYDCNSNKLQLN